MKIGYQGDIISNNYYAAMKYAEQINIEFDGVPLINSYPVLNALVNKEIDYGVVAFENSTAGPVKETQIALQTFEGRVREVAKIVLPIHHCLFKRASADSASVKYIYSHEQALRQCEGYIRMNYPNAEVKQEIDTSLAALNLSSDKYEPNSAVICSRECGIHYGLNLIEENIEDNKNNQTTFKVFVRAD